MLHQRHPTKSSLPSSPTIPRTAPAYSSGSPSGPSLNKAYTPLRRGSSGYNGSAVPPSPSAGPGARGGRYPSNGISPGLPSAEAGGGLGYGKGGGGGSYELGDGLGWDGGRKASEGILGKVRDVFESLTKGFGDAVRLDRSWNLVWGDRELRTLVLKSTLINLLSLLLLSLSSLVFSPLLVHPVSPIMETRTKEIGMWYNILLSWPVFVVCFWVNASWGPDISRRAQALLHPTYRHQPTPSTPTSASTNTAPSSKAGPKPLARVFTSIARIFLISDFTLVSRLIGYVPVVGRMGSFAYMCVIDAYYCFEWNFSMKQWPLDYRIEYIQDRTAYMLGFGFPATFLTSFGPPLVCMAVFALIYPFFVIQALQSRPPSRQSSLLPSTPSPRASLPPSPIGGSSELNLNDPFFSSAGSKRGSSVSNWSAQDWSNWEPRLPIFWIARYALDGLKWLEDAVGRDRTGSGGGFGRERAGKRLM
ncbi:hypothetical protein IAT38_002734 [Cryptococcus sp. DSM 104549]